MESDKWLTLPEDLLVDIFRRLETTAVIRCAIACRPWRRTIIDNAWCLRPRPDRFLPEVLLGFLDNHLGFSTRLQQYVPATNTEVPRLFTPATGVGVGVSVDGRLYNNLLSSRDGLLLLGENRYHESLCLYEVVTGACKVVPTAALFHSCNSMRCMYVLATGYDVDDGGDEAAVWILAVKRVGDSKDGLIYQIFSSTSGTWGPVKCSAKFPEDVAYAYTNGTSLKGGVVVFHGAVCWFVYLFPNLGDPKSRIRTCVFSVDLRTARTWTTEIPDMDDGDPGHGPSSPILAESEDGQLSLAKILPDSHQIEVWVHDGDDQWTLRRTIDDVQKLLPNCPSVRHMSLSGFCPRSGFLFGTGTDDQNRHHHFVIGVDGSSPGPVGGHKSSSDATRFPYEMDWSVYISSYISKMKYF